MITKIKRVETITVRELLQRSEGYMREILKVSGDMSEKLAFNEIKPKAARKCLSSVIRKFVDDAILASSFLAACDVAYNKSGVSSEESDERDALKKKVYMQVGNLKKFMIKENSNDFRALDKEVRKFYAKDSAYQKAVDFLSHYYLCRFDEMILCDLSADISDTCRQLNEPNHYCEGVPKPWHSSSC